MSGPSTIHPDVLNTLKYVDSYEDKLLSARDKMRAVTAERLSEDRDIAVKTDMNGQLVELWLKPGLLDRKSAAVIAKEITQLVVAAGRESEETVAALYHETHHKLPSYEEFVAESDAASPPVDPNLRR